ncbi:MAG: dihydropyrimidinase [Candidatus Dormibacteria bacterium]
MRLMIRGGLVVTAEQAVAQEVLIEGEGIEAVVAPDSELARQYAQGCDRVLDAQGRYVLPGGVDVHTHMEMPFGGTFSADTFETGTRAAAWGGTTTIVDFAIQTRGQSLLQGLETWRAKAEGRCAVDYGFHMIVADVTQSSLAEMPQLVEEGVSSFKLFMAYPGVFYSTDGQILLAMQAAAQCGALIQMHAENGIAIDQLVAQALARGEVAPRFHGSTRPSILEGEATNRAIQLARATGCPLYIVHLSAAEALARVVDARDRNQAVFAETCPQYLFLNDSDLAREDFEGAKFVCSPPLRDRSHQLELWRGLRSDDLAVVATDHCPFCFREQKELGVGDFSKIPNGLPGVEHRLDLLHQGVLDQRITLRRWVELCSTAPARMFGLYPRKGAIAPGADADLVIYNPDSEHTLSAATHHMNVDYSCYEGLAVRGGVETVLLRGQVVLEGGAYRGRPGDGRFLARGQCQYLN